MKQLTNQVRSIQRSTIAAIVFCLLFAGCVSIITAADIHFDSRVVYNEYRDPPAKNKDVAWGFTAIDDEVVTVSDDIANDPSIIDFRDHRGWRFRASAVSIKHDGGLDSVLVRLYVPYGQSNRVDSTQTMWLTPEPPGEQTWTYLGYVDSLRVLKGTDYGTTQVHVQAF